jgi:hypothetical protein
MHQGHSDADDAEYGSDDRSIERPFHIPKGIAFAFLAFAYFIL